MRREITVFWREKISILLDLKQCSLIKTHQCFWGTCFPFLQSEELAASNFDLFWRCRKYKHFGTFLPHDIPTHPICEQYADIHFTRSMLHVRCLSTFTIMKLRKTLVLLSLQSGSTLPYTLYFYTQFQYIFIKKTISNTTAYTDRQQNPKMCSRYGICE